MILVPFFICGLLLKYSQGMRGARILPGPIQKLSTLLPSCEGPDLYASSTKWHSIASGTSPTFKEADALSKLLSTPIAEREAFGRKPFLNRCSASKLLLSPELPQGLVSVKDPDESLSPVAEKGCQLYPDQARVECLLSHTVGHDVVTTAAARDDISEYLKSQKPRAPTLELLPYHLRTLPESKSSSSRWEGGAMGGAEKDFDFHNWGKGCDRDGNLLRRKGKVGSGATGSVYMGELKGKEGEEKLFVAAKVINCDVPRPGMTSTKKILGLQEIRVLTKLREEGFHPHITNLITFFEDYNTLVLVEESFESPANLREMMRVGPMEGGDTDSWHVFGEALAKRVLFQLLSALQFLHQKNFAHFDVKPENIILDADLFIRFHEVDLKLTDFGAATEVNREGHGCPQAFTEMYVRPVELMQEQEEERRRNQVDLHPKDAEERDEFGSASLDLGATKRFRSHDNFSAPSLSLFRGRSSAKQDDIFGAALVFFEMLNGGLNLVETQKSLPFSSPEEMSKQARGSEGARKLLKEMMEGQSEAGELLKSSYFDEVREKSRKGHL